MMQNETVSTYWDALWKQAIKNVSSRLLLPIAGECKLSKTSWSKYFMALMVDEMLNAKLWLQNINRKLKPKDIKYFQFTLSFDNKKLKLPADFRMIVLEDTNNDVYVFSNSWDIYDKHEDCLILKTTGQKIERCISNEQMLKNFEYQVQSTLKINNIKFQMDCFRDKKPKVHVNMKKWIVTSRESQGYTEDNCGQKSNNKQVICIIEAKDAEDAYNKLKKEKPHLFAIDLWSLSMRWTGFNFYELNYKTQPIEIIIQNQEEK